MSTSSSPNNINPQAFFHSFLPQFLTSCALPAAFMNEVKGELKDHVLESVVLLTNNQHWVVKIEQGRRFNVQDWKKFALHHELKMGDFLTFRHLGNFLFHVSLFDSLTACEYSTRESTLSNEHEHEHEHEREHEVPSKSLKRKRGRPSLPSCSFTFSAYGARHNILYLPKKFTRESGLAVRSCEVTFIDHRKRSWKVGLNYKKCGGQCYIQKGWKTIQEAYLINPGDVIELQTLNLGNHPVFKFSFTAYQFSTRESTRPNEQEHEREQEHEVPSKGLKRKRGGLPLSRCSFTFSDYGARRNVLILPMKFTRENRLLSGKCEVTLIDQKKRSWQVRLNYNKSSRQCYINCGWKAFQDTNRVKSGDVINLEILHNGKNPVFKCSVTACDSSKRQCPLRVKQEAEENEEEEHEEAASKKRKRGRQSFPSCNLTLTPYRAHYSMDYLPMKFVRDSGLTRRRCEVTLIDQKKRSWKVGLNYKESDEQSYLKTGWKAFQNANLLKPGDVITLQTLSAGKQPVLKCLRYTPRVKQEIEQDEVEVIEEEEHQAEMEVLEEEEHEAEVEEIEEHEAEVEVEVIEIEEEEEEEEEEDHEAEVEVIEEDDEEEEEAPSRMRKKGRIPFPSCNLTLTPYRAHCGILYLPRKFIRDSGFTRRSCQVTLIDHKNRSWQVALSYKKGDMASYLDKGWKVCQDANHLKPGDVFSLQTLNSGTHPLLKCSSNPSQLFINR